MTFRPAYAIAAVIALTLGTSANAAEPAPADQRPAETAAPRAPALLAAAAKVDVPTPQSVAEVAPPARKPRAARVTSCRCGEGEASPR